MAKEEQEYAFKGVWIPVRIWLAKDISWMEKCLLAEINALDKGDHRACYATNEHLGEHFGTSPGSIANQISKLRKLNYLRTMSFDGRERSMRVNPEAITGLRQRSPGGEVWNHSEVKAPIREVNSELPLEEVPPTPKGEKDGITSFQTKRDFSEGFDEFWRDYPKKVSKQAALRAWKKNRCADIIEEIILALCIQRLWHSWTKKDGQYIPYPASWLNDHGWKNEEHGPQTKHEEQKPKKGF